MLDMIAQYLPTIGVAIGVAVTWLWAEYRKKKKEDEATIAERERSYTERLEGRLKDREVEIERLSKDLLAARTIDQDPEDVLKNLVDSDIGISWVKRRVSSTEYRMLRVSAGYARILLKDAPEYYDGKSDAEVWGDETAARFLANDEDVHARQEGKHVVEEVKNGRFIGRKFPIYISGRNYIIGIGDFEVVGDV